MYEVSVEGTFSAGHALRGYRGKCENPHGHNYRVRVTLEGRELDSIGLLYDFTHIKRMLRDVISELDHKFLNDMAPFDTVNPSAENIAKFFHEQTVGKIEQAPNAPRIAKITVWETDDTSATYTP